MSSSFGTLTEFHADVDDIEVYIDRLEQFFLANAITDDNRKAAILLTSIGNESYKLLLDLTVPKKPKDHTYEELLNLLSNQLSTKRSIFAERYKFYAAYQTEDETIDRWTAKLKHLAKFCNFGSNLDDSLRDKFIVGIKDANILNRLFAETSTLTFSKAVEIATTMETAKKHTDEIRKGVRQINPLLHQHFRSQLQQQKSHPTTNHVKRIHKNKAYPAEKENAVNECNCCGRSNHTTKDCRFLHYKCNRCGKSGHLAKMCKASKSNSQQKSPEVQKVQNLLQQAEEEEIVNMYQIDNKDIYNPVVIQVRIEGVNIEMQFDTGASISVIPKEIYEKQFSHIPIEQTPLILRSFSGNKIKPTGVIQVHVRYKETEKKLRLLVVPNKGPSLLGRDWMANLNIQMPVLTIENEPLPKETIKQSKDLQAGEKIRNDGSTTASSGEHKSEASKVLGTEPQLAKLIEKYVEIFAGDEQETSIKGVKIKIRLQENARPIVHKPRPVPFALKASAEAEINRLLQEGILEPVDPVCNPIEWASPVVYVPKPNGRVRLCGDFKVTINPYLIRDPHPLPRFEDIVEKLSGASMFSIIDLKDAYLQLEVDPDSRNYLVIATHKGYFRYKRLPFGIATAPAVFQKFMDTVLQGLEGVAWYLDDICVAGKTKQEHLERLDSVFQRLHDARVRTQKSKLKLCQESVKFLGYTIDKKGIHPTEEGVTALRDQPAPKNVHELRSFLGSINYYSRFIPNLQSRCAPLHKLLQKNMKWQWTKEDEEIFEDLKRSISSNDTLVHFNPTLPLVLATDASEKGIGAILMHRFPDGLDHPIAVASRSLSKSEKNYSSIDREALAIMFGVSKFHQYCYGRQFTLQTDHKPLERVLGEKHEIPKMAASRLTRWAISLSAYDYKIEYKTAKENVAADALSRLPLSTAISSELENDAPLSVNQIQEIQIGELPLTRSVLRKKTRGDPTLGKVMEFLERGWPEKRNLHPNFNSFYEKREEISCEENILMWQNRIIVPQALRREVLAYLHTGHPGVVAMKSLTRFSVWWPQIDQDVENMVKTCYDCQQNRNKETETPIFPWNIPQQVWDRVHVDLCGPIEGERYFVIIDAYSRWCEIFPAKSVTSETLIRFLRSLFARYGICRQIVSDNGPQLVSKEFDQFCKRNGIIHIKSTPYHSRTNGMAERVIQNFERHFKMCKNVYPDLEHRLQVFLFTYRSLPHGSTGRTPAELFLGRRILNVLDRLKPDTQRNMDTACTKQKLYHDQHKKLRHFEENAAVWVKRQAKSPWKAGTVIRKTGPLSYMVEVDGKQCRYHADQMRIRDTH